jgi:hypothetical protein
MNIDEAEKIIQEEIDTQMDNAQVSMLFGGDEIYISGGTMSKEEWSEVGDDIIGLMNTLYYTDYYVYSCCENGVGLMSEEPV